jgi:hypothetical protein
LLALGGLDASRRASAQMQSAKRIVSPTDSCLPTAGLNGGFQHRLTTIVTNRYIASDPSMDRVSQTQILVTECKCSL